MGSQTNEKPRVLLIGWDAADWRHIDPLIQRGEMPNLERFLSEGVRGNVSTLQPVLSPILWNTIATGKHPDEHGILGFAEIDPASGKARPVTSTSRRCKAIWNILDSLGRPSGVINWYASHPAEQINGFVVTDRFAQPTGPLIPGEPSEGWTLVQASVHPKEDLDDLARVRVHPMMVTRAQSAAFVPKLEDDTTLQRVLDDETLREKLAELRALIAHGASVHNAATAYITDRDWDFLAVYYDEIDRMAHAFMEYAAPRMDHVNPEHFELFKDVMDACYRYHDLMLGRLLSLIDDTTSVMILSDHGFYSGDRRPGGTSGIKGGQPVSWHRTYGMIAARGPGIRKGETIRGASLLDVCPTLLTMLGERPATDMPGRVLTQLFESTPDLTRVETYETGEQNALDSQAPHDPLADEQMLDQLRRLGYLADDGPDGTDPIIIDRHRNLASVYMMTGRPRLAIREYRKILEIKDDDRGAKVSIATALLNLGKHRASERIVRDLIEADPDAPRTDQLLGMICRARGDLDGAATHLASALKRRPDDPSVMIQLAGVLMQQDRFDEAEPHLNRALEIEPDDAEALDTLGVLYRRTRRVPESVLSHVQAVALMHHKPRAHINLALALAAAGQGEWAIDAAMVALSLNPKDPETHSVIATIAQRSLQDDELAARHMDIAETIRKSRSRERAEALNASTDRARHQPQSVESSDAPITVVSGIPRSGTSLMMQIIERAGIQPLTDALRTPDESNPRGYYELERVKHAIEDHTWVDDASGKCVKVIHALLPTLPRDRRYRVVFMTRDPSEIVRSQNTMLGRLGKRASQMSDAQLRQYTEIETNRALRLASSLPCFDLHVVDYNELLSEPDPILERLARFLQVDVDARTLKSAIDPSLYRSHNDDPQL